MYLLDRSGSTQQRWADATGSEPEMVKYENNLANCEVDRVYLQRQSEAALEAPAWLKGECGADANVEKF